MVKLGVYAVDGAEKEDLKKDELKKPPIDAVLTNVQILPEGVAVESKKQCCTTRRLLLMLFFLLLIGAGVAAGGLTYRIFVGGDEHHKKEKFDLHVDFDEPRPDKQEGHRPPPPHHDPAEPLEPVDERPDIRPPLPPMPNPAEPTRPHPTQMMVSSTTVTTSGSVDEEIEVDEDEGTEKFEIPSAEGCEQVTVIHDFTVGLSAYRLWTSERCFVKPLDNACMPPFMLAQLMRDPNYLRQHFEMVRENYLAVPPPIHDVFTLGPFIAERCLGVPTYWLEEATEAEDEPEPVLPAPFDAASEEDSSSFEDWPWFRPPSSDHHDSGEDHRGHGGHRHRRGDFNERNFLDKSKMEQTKIRYFDSDNKVKEMKFYFK